MTIAGLRGLGVICKGMVGVEITGIDNEEGSLDLNLVQEDSVQGDAKNKWM